MKLELENVVKKYGEIIALNEFSYVFDKGIYGILGINGAGKSTLFNLLTDNLKPNGGNIKLDDKDIYLLGDNYRKRVGYMPQQQGFYDKMTGYAYLKYVAYLKGMNKKDAIPQIEELLNQMNLWDKRFSKVENYSGGMKQRLLIASALLDDPEILILDEPTVGLDPRERAIFKKYLKKISTEKIVLIATHIVSDVESLADKVIIMKSGSISVSGTIAEVKEKNDITNLEDLFVTE